ncbi:Peptidyl-prolyl cis-trans isomerase-like 4 [Coemansia sp. RSA 2611]|nr:Peptidyl-prolyl cis-trans isomerase-like 4 [Coemansia sp. RSA 2610]KAJ2390277.1 Peptidyl-prolyl cis-trans isomerase-like 4 [Coemansia sp. RSA 2611]
MSVLLETSLGDIVVDLFVDETPLASKNFLKLCKSKYYNFTYFHRVERDFIAQAGDPTGTGNGGQSIYGQLGGSALVPGEIRPQLKHERGTVSMVGQSGTGAVGSQFFIALGDQVDYLDGKHTVVGRVAEGMSVVDELSQSICDKDSRPLRDVLIRHTIILDDPFDDPPGLQCPSSPLVPSREQQSLLRIEARYEQLATADSESARRERDARAQALTLEMIGDLPYADVRPPENILFVCKLNPLTQSDDLHTIFARFGTIDSCQVICDPDTGASLGYAFVEFREKSACEEAYFKMDNVLVDDRRIRVDFSQSVSRVRGKWVRLRDGGKYQARRKYRGDSSRPAVDQYEMVFDSGSKDKRRQQRRSQSPSHRHRRSPDRHRRSRHD